MNIGLLYLIVIVSILALIANIIFVPIGTTTYGFDIFDGKFRRHLFACDTANSLAYRFIYKSIKMAKLVFTVFLLWSTSCYAQFQSKIASDYIRIDHAGPSDAMIEPIIVTKKKLTLPVPEVPIQVSQDIFESLTKCLDDSARLFPQREINEFGVFKVTISVGNKAEVCFTGTRKKSVDFLREFRKLLQDLGAPDELVKKAERILKRIDY